MVRGQENPGPAAQRIGHPCRPCRRYSLARPAISSSSGHGFGSGWNPSRQARTAPSRKNYFRNPSRNDLFGSMLLQRPRGSRFGILHLLFCKEQSVTRRLDFQNLLQCWQMATEYKHPPKWPMGIGLGLCSNEQCHETRLDY